MCWRLSRLRVTVGPGHLSCSLIFIIENVTSTQRHHSSWVNVTGNDNDTVTPWAYYACAVLCYCGPAGAG